MPAQLLDNRLFAGIPTAVTEAICADIPLVTLAKDELLFHEGDPGDCFYLVCEGSICISKIGRAGKQETLCFMGPGNYFGEMALIDGQPRSAQASAAEPSVVGLIDSATFDRIFALAPREFNLNLLRSVTERLRDVNSHFISELIRTERLSLLGTMANTIIHDLRNPISIIRGCSELLSLKVQDPAVLRFTTMTDRAITRMMDMIQEILDFSRGHSSFQLHRHSLQEVLEEFQTQLEPLLTPNISLNLQIQAEGDVNVDVGRFARMLLNLAKNSIEAMSNGGTLTISVSKADGQFKFEVTDTGCGLPPELQAKIFEPFVTFGKSKGTGLGMAIVKSVVEAHHGTISLHSQVGVGTTMLVSIPELPKSLQETGS